MGAASGLAIRVEIAPSSASSSDSSLLTPRSSIPIGITFQPGESIPEGDYFFTLKLTARNHAGFTVPIHVAVTQAGEGGLLFKVVDAFLGLPDANAPGGINQGVIGAGVTIQNEQVPSVQFSLTTNEFGEALFENVPVGHYKYVVRADKRQESIGRIWVRPGAVISQQVSLAYQPVTVTWQVVPTTIQDR